MLWSGEWEPTMSALAIRDDIGSEELRRRARRERDGRVSARLIAIANALEGMDRTSAARLAGMDRQTLRDWVHRDNAEGIAGLCNRPAPGRRPKLTEGQMAALKAVVPAGPDPTVDSRTGRRDRATRRAARRPNRPSKKGVCCPLDGNRAGSSGSRAV